MENNINDLNQPAPSIEKVSVAELRQEQSNLDLEADTPINNLIKSMLALEGEDLDKALVFVKKKLEILKNRK